LIISKAWAALNNLFRVRRDLARAGSWCFASAMRVNLVGSVKVEYDNSHSWLAEKTLAPRWTEPLFSACYSEWVRDLVALNYFAKQPWHSLQIRRPTGRIALIISVREDEARPL